jgi:hypothetical protein
MIARGDKVADLLPSTCPTPTKAKKDPNQPKRPLSAYNFFFKFERAKINGEDLLTGGSRNTPEEVKRIRRKNPTRKMHFGELARTIGSRWKALALDQREPYVEMAKVEKERYTIEVVAYKETQREKSDSEAKKMT